MFKNFLVLMVFCSQAASAMDDFSSEMKGNTRVRAEFKSHLRRLKNLNETTWNECQFYEVEPALEYRDKMGQDYDSLFGRFEYSVKRPTVKVYDESAGEIQIVAKGGSHKFDILLRNDNDYVPIRAYSLHYFYSGSYQSGMSFLTFEDSDTILIVKNSASEEVYKIYECAEGQFSYFALDLGYYKKHPELTPVMYPYLPPRFVDEKKLNDLKAFVLGTFKQEKSKTSFKGGKLELNFHKFIYNRHAIVAVLKDVKPSKNKEYYFCFYAVSHPGRDFHPLCDYDTLCKNIIINSLGSTDWEKPFFNGEPTTSLFFEDLLLEAKAKQRAYRGSLARVGLVVLSGTLVGINYWYRYFQSS